MTALDKDLERSPSPHSLFKLVYLPKGGVSMPMMVCGSQTDSVVNPPALDDWHNWLKPDDKLCQFPQGDHFFHYFHPQEVGEQILNFWGCYQRRSSLAISAQPSLLYINEKLEGDEEIIHLPNR